MRRYSCPLQQRDASGRQSLLITLGRQAARVKARFSAVWNGAQHQVSFMTAGTANAGNVKRSIVASEPSDQGRRLAQGRAIAVQQMREQRVDPETNMQADFSLVILPGSPPTSLVAAGDRNRNRNRNSTARRSKVARSKAARSVPQAGRRQAGMLNESS